MFLVGLTLGLQLGYYAQLLKKWLKDLIPKEPVAPPTVGITRGSYNEPHTQGKSGAIVTPKTPQQIEYDVAEDLRRMNNR